MPIASCLLLQYLHNSISNRYAANTSVPRLKLFSNQLIWEVSPPDRHSLWCQGQRGCVELFRMPMREGIYRPQIKTLTLSGIRRVVAFFGFVLCCRRVWESHEELLPACRNSSFTGHHLTHITIPSAIMTRAARESRLAIIIY